MESISEQLEKDRLLQGMVQCREFFVSSWSQNQRIYVLVSKSEYFLRSYSQKDGDIRH